MKKSRFKDECDGCHEFHVLTNCNGKLLCDNCATEDDQHVEYEQLEMQFT